MRRDHQHSSLKLGPTLCWLTEHPSLVYTEQWTFLSSLQPTFYLHQTLVLLVFTFFGSNPLESFQCLGLALGKCNLNCSWIHAWVLLVHKVQLEQRKRQNASKARLVMSIWQKFKGCKGKEEKAGVGVGQLDDAQLSISTWNWGARTCSSSWRWKELFISTNSPQFSLEPQNIFWLQRDTGKCSYSFQFWLYSLIVVVLSQ